MELHITCACGRRTLVTPAKCGGSVRCICGETVSVPPLSELKLSASARENLAASLPSPIHEYGEPQPVRYWAFAISGLLFLFGLLQTIAIIPRMRMGPVFIAFTIAFAILGFIGAFKMYKYAVPRNE